MSAPPPPPYPDWHQHYHSRFSRFGRFGHGGPGGYRGFGLCRRLFWLALGAGAYAFWSSRHQEMERYRQVEGGAAAGVDQDQRCARRWGCHRRREREIMREQPHWQQHPAPPVMTDHPVVDEKQGLYARVHVGPSPPSIRASGPAPYNLLDIQGRTMDVNLDHSNPDGRGTRGIACCACRRSFQRQELLAALGRQQAFHGVSTCRL